MIFKQGEQICVISIDGHRFALPNAFQHFSERIKQKICKDGHSYELCGRNVLIEGIIENPQKLERFDDHPKYKCQAIAITNASYIARESRLLLDKLGVKLFLDGSAKIFGRMYIVMDEKDNNFYAMQDLKSGFRLIAESEGYFTDENIFSCDMGDCFYREK